jgi:ribose transport system substrate-binding protein
MQTPTPVHAPLRPLVTAMALLLAVALALTGCTTPEQAASTNQVAESDLSEPASAAKDAVQPLMTEKASWNGPASSPPPTAGKRLAVVTCCLSSEGAVRPAMGAKEAGEAIGWTVDVFDGKGDPQIQNQALNAAVDANYDAIALMFIDTPTVNDGVRRALAADIPLITLGALRNTPETIPDVSHDWAASGEAVANYMIWKSNADVQALLLKNSDLVIVESGQFAGTTKVLGDPNACPGCRMETKEWALANLDTQPAAIAVASLQADPELNWVWCFDSCMGRTARTLAANGLQDRVMGAGFDCNGENLQLIKSRQVQAVCAADPREWEGYGLVDNVNRLFNGQPAVQQNIPIRLFDASNLDQLSDEEIQHGWQGDVDFRAMYRELWGVAS